MTTKIPSLNTTITPTAPMTSATDTASDAPERLAPAPGTDADDGDQLVGRTATAELLDVSLSKVRRLEERGELPAIVDERGVHFHSIQQINNFKIRQFRTNARPGAVDGAVAAAAFELFDQGKNPADVVKELHLDPQLAQELHSRWANLRGGFVVSGKVAVELEFFGFGESGHSIRTQEDLVRLFKEIDAADRHECACCNNRPPRFCVSCTLEKPARVRAIAQQRIRQAEARHQEQRRRETERGVVARASDVATEARRERGT